MGILPRDKVKRNKFAGVIEHRLVVDNRVMPGGAAADAWHGLGNFVYLADAHLVAHGETGLHDHHNLGVISIVLAGQLRHDGSLHAGQVLGAYDVQVQHAGSAGFSHNEITPTTATVACCNCGYCRSHPRQRRTTVFTGLYRVTSPAFTVGGPINRQPSRLPPALMSRAWKAVKAWRWMCRHWSISVSGGAAPMKTTPARATCCESGG